MWQWPAETEGQRHLMSAAGPVRLGPVTKLLQAQLPPTGLPQRAQGEASPGLQVVRSRLHIKHIVTQRQHRSNSELRRKH